MTPKLSHLTVAIRLALRGWVFWLVLLLAACGQQQDIIIPDKPPEIVRVQVEVPVSLCPEGGGGCDLLRDCYDEDPKAQTYNEAKRLANLRRASIREDCNVRLAKIRALQPDKGPSTEAKP